MAKTKSADTLRQAPISGRSLRRQLAAGAVLLLACWSMLAFVRASSLALERPDPDPALPLRDWKLGGPQLEELRLFLEAVVLANTEEKALIVVDPQTDNALDSLALGGYCQYLLPDRRVVHIGQYVALDIDTDSPRYLLRYPGAGDRSTVSARLVASAERGSLWQL